MAAHTRSQHSEDDHPFRTHPSALIENARNLRKNMTDAEWALWSVLSRKQTQHRFRRQHPINRYIADFVCIKQKLIIELDGGQHQEQTAAYDAKRTATLEQLGYRVLRFWNNEVTENLEAVYERILEALNGKVVDSGEIG